MGYTVKSSEKLRKTAAEMETKALLYLMNFSSYSNDIHYFVVDFFNDLTGMDNFATKLYDLQSKGAKNSSPKSIGKELVTLFKNYISDIEFEQYILFFGEPTSTFKKDSTLTSFGIENIKKDALSKMIDGLKEECNKKTYIDNAMVKEELIIDFMNKVLFVIDDKPPENYVMKIIENHLSIIPSNDLLRAIFNEIRDKQSVKKNISIVEEITISETAESLQFFRHLTANEIKLLTLQRIINRDPVTKNIPESFLPICNACPPENKKEMLENCQQSMCRALFNKNQAVNFWSLFENIYIVATKNPKYTIDMILSLTL